MLPNVTREQQLIILGLILLIVVGSGVSLYRNYSSANTAAESLPLQSFQPSLVHSALEKQIVVHVSGQVNQEGVYKLKEGARLVDLIQLAGGFGARADVGSLNLASVMKDGQKIEIPGQEAKPNNRATADSTGDKVNINTASNSQLAAIPGVGPSTAKKIVEYRQQHGRFAKLEDIMKVPSIGKAKFNKIKDHITSQ